MLAVVDDPSQVSPGLAGFLTVFALALATVVLVRSMVGRLRKVRYGPGPDQPPVPDPTVAGPVANGLGAGDPGTDDPGADAGPSAAAGDRPAGRPAQAKDGSAASG